MYATLEERFDAAMAKTDGYRVLEIGAVDPKIGIAPAIAWEYVRLSRIPALSKAQALIGTVDSVEFLTPVLTEKAKLQCSRMLGILARC